VLFVLRRLHTHQFACTAACKPCAIPARPRSCSADGLAQQFLTSLAKLKAGKDCVLALAGTLSLLSLTAEDANPCYLKSVAAAVLLDQLLQVGGAGGQLRQRRSAQQRSTPKPRATNYSHLAAHARLSCC
jgi:hypothetical protein